MFCLPIFSSNIYEACIQRDFSSYCPLSNLLWVILDMVCSALFVNVLQESRQIISSLEDSRTSTDSRQASVGGFKSADGEREEKVEKSTSVMMHFVKGHKQIGIHFNQTLYTKFRCF